MTAPPVSATMAAVAPPDGAMRLLRGLGGADEPLSWSEHVARWGPLELHGRRTGRALLDEFHRSGLRGHGGAWFPVAVKWEAVASKRLGRPVVVGNGAEGEPASAKDRLLLARAPHLVIDGLMVAATAVGSSKVVLHVPSRQLPGLDQALRERRRAGVDDAPVELVPAVDRFIAGEESAVVSHLNGGAGGRPSFTALSPVYRKGVDGRPTLVQNVETLAHAALVARFGAEWFRAVGTEASPGTGLLTVTTAGTGSRVVEVPFGAGLVSALAVLGVGPSEVGAVLFGGYGGTWVAGRTALGLPLAEEHLRSVGATLGAGVVLVTGPEACPLMETARIARYLEGEGAGQCGPCVNGLPAIAETVEVLAYGVASDRGPATGAGGGVRARLLGLCDLVEGRGACHHPDGVARMVRSAVLTFADHVEQHLRAGPCRGVHVAPMAPVPRRTPSASSAR